MPRKPLAVLYGAGPALFLVLVAVWEIGAARCDATSVPDDDAWDVATRAVRASYQPGDLIVFAPDWIDPVGRLHLGDLISLDMAGRMDAARYGRIWELSIRGARAPDTDGLTPAAVIDGAVTVRRFERAPAIVVTDFAAELAVASVVDGVRPSLELAEVGFAPHRCIEVTPVPNQPTRITFAQVPLGSTLVGYVGLADVFTRRDVRAPGELAVEINGARVADVRPGVDDGWVRFEAPTAPGVANVAFVASAGVQQRLICFAAEARK